MLLKRFRMKDLYMSVRHIVFIMGIAFLLSACASDSAKVDAESSEPEQGEPQVHPKNSEPAPSQPAVDDRSLKASIDALLKQVKAAKGDNDLFPWVWGVTPAVRKISTNTPYEDARTLRITSLVEETLLTAHASSDIGFSLVQLKEMERLLGFQRKQFSDLYSDEDDGVVPGELVRAQAFLFGTITGKQGENLSLELIDATTRHKYAQVSALLPPDPTPPPPPLSLTITAFQCNLL